MLDTILLLFGTLATAVTGHPVGVLEPPIITRLAISSGMPYKMATPSLSHNVKARSYDWATATPAWTFPIQSWAPNAVQTVVVTATPTHAYMATSTPLYTYEETHNDSKNTRIHEIIAGLVIGGVFGIAIIWCLIGTLVSRCRRGRFRNQGTQEDIEAARALSIGSSDGGQPPSAIHNMVVNDRKTPIALQPPAPPRKAHVQSST